MTATSRIGPIAVPGAAELPLAQPTVVATPRSPALALRLGLREWPWPRRSSAGCCSATPIQICGRPATGRLRELLPAAIAFSIGGAILLRYHKARWPSGALLICGLLAGLALLLAGLWWNAMLVHGALAQPLFVANGIATDQSIPNSDVSFLLTGVILSALDKT